MDKITSSDLLLSFLYSPGIYSKVNEPIIGRTKLTKMIFLFEKEIQPIFFKNNLELNAKFIPYFFGPFSKELFEDLSFFITIKMIITQETSIPLTPMENTENESVSYKDTADEWDDIYLNDHNDQQFELSYSLSKQGIDYVVKKIWCNYSKEQKEVLKKFKKQINSISLDSLLRYVYNKYPDTTINSKIADKYLQQGG